MHDELGLISEVLTTPLLEAELTGHEIGRNRVRVLRLLYKLLKDRCIGIQIWLADSLGDWTELRLAYWCPSLSNEYVEDVKGSICRVPKVTGESRFSSSHYTSEVLRCANYQFELVGITASHRHLIEMPNPIPKGSAKSTSSLSPLAWAIFALREPLTLAQSQAAKVLAFNFSILLEHGRIHRIVETTNACTQALHSSTSLEVALRECALQLANSCAAQAGGHVEFVNGVVSSLGFPDGCALTEKDKSDIHDLLLTKVFPIPALHELFTDVANGREFHSNPSLGNLLFIPILAPGISLITAPFSPLGGAEEELGRECETVTHAIFLIRKSSPNFLGVNFSATDRKLCRSVSRNLSNAAFSRFFEELFLSLNSYFSTVPLDSEIDLDDVFDRIRRIVPSASFLELYTVYRETSGQLTINPAQGSAAVPNGIVNEFIERESNDIFGCVSNNVEETIECACCVIEHERVALIFRISTNYVPLRFYVIEFGSSILEAFRFQLLKHFMRELFNLHRARDLSEQRSSLLAQIRHAVVDPLAAATNNIDVYQSYLNECGKDDESWSELRSDREFRELIPQAKYLNHQALLFIDTGRFLLSNLTYSNIKFEQYRPKDLIRTVRTAFNYGLRERGQSWSLKLVGDDRRYAVGDSLLLWMAMATLIDNAIKYGRRETPINVVINHLESEWSFSVENTGDYLDPSLREDIFRPFVRGHKADTGITRRQGTGIGLTVAQKVVQAHCATSSVHFTSKRKSDGKTASTRFWFTLPYRLASRADSSGDQVGLIGGDELPERSS